MDRYSWLRISDEWDLLMDRFEGPKSLRYQLYLLGDKSYRAKNIMDEFIREIKEEKVKAFDELWEKSGWTEAQWYNELNRRLDPEHWGKPRWSCAKDIEHLPRNYRGKYPVCVLDKNHEGLCQTYPEAINE